MTEHVICRVVVVVEVDVVVAVEAVVVVVVDVVGAAVVVVVAGRVVVVVSCLSHMPFPFMSRQQSASNGI